MKSLVDTDLRRALGQKCGSVCFNYGCLFIRHWDKSNTKKLPSIELLLIPANKKLRNYSATQQFFSTVHLILHFNYFIYRVRSFIHVGPKDPCLNFQVLGGLVARWIENLNATDTTD